MDINSALSQATQSTPCPWLGPAFGFLIPLINLLTKAGSNKNCMRQLEERCRSLLDIIQSEGETMTPDDKTRLCSAARRTIQSVLDRMTPWCSMPRMELFVKQDKHAKVIGRCHRAISNCLNKLQITSHLEFHRRHSTFKENHRIGNNFGHMIQYLGDLRNKQEIFIHGQLQQTSTTNQILTMMQESLPGHISARAEHGLESNLYNLLRSSRTLLPDMNLKRGEVRRTSDYAVNGTAWTDVWEGCYLNEEKVAIIVLRSAYATPKTLKRFKMETEIWRRVFETDKGEHILTIYGFRQEDGEWWPYTVSPWMSNGNLKDYVNDHPEVDHRSILKGIVEGIKLLHSMSIVHGDIKAINIAISTDGRPLLSNFGFTRLEEDIMSDHVRNEHWFDEQSLRWCPAIVLGESVKITMASDVYAFSMTVLELMTHEKPWASVRFGTHVFLMVCKGKTPPRPTDPVVAERGLDDALWALLEKCWCKNMHDRPTMKEIASCL